jgi:NIMA (never in mitosis gene a)-related kinase
MLRGLKRGEIKSVLQTASSQPTSQPSSGNNPGVDDGPEVNDDGAYVNEKRAIAKQSKEMLGKGKLDGPDEFGESPDGSAQQEEHITMASGESVPAKRVRVILEAEMGKELLNKAVGFVSDAMAHENPPANALLQRELNNLVGLRFAHNSNAIAKLAVWEGKNL